MDDTTDSFCRAPEPARRKAMPGRFRKISVTFHQVRCPFKILEVPAYKFTSWDKCLVGVNWGREKAGRERLKDYLSWSIKDNSLLRR